MGIAMIAQTYCKGQPFAWCDTWNGICFATEPDVYCPPENVFEMKHVADAVWEGDCTHAPINERMLRRMLGESFRSQDNAEMAGRDSERYADEFVEPNGGK